MQNAEPRHVVSAFGIQARLPIRVIPAVRPSVTIGRMITQLSNQMADIVERVAPAVVQVQGDRRPASGLVYGPDQVLTSARAVGREERPHVRRHDGQSFEAQVAGWDPATRSVVLSAPGLGVTPLVPGKAARVGEIAIALARSWSNAITATAGLVSIVGGPLPTGRRRAIEQVIRTSAPMHEGFSGGALVGADGGLLGVTTAASIRGLGVVIPAAIAWKAAADALQRGSEKRGYLGVAAQPVSVTGMQRDAAGADEALLVAGVKSGTPAADAGILVGDLLLALDGERVTSPEGLLDLLAGERVGRPVVLQLLRGGAKTEVQVVVAERR
jgi:S1-C subfamily serine protease